MSGRENRSHAFELDSVFKTVNIHNKLFRFDPGPKNPEKYAAPSNAASSTSTTRATTPLEAPLPLFDAQSANVITGDTRNS